MTNLPIDELALWYRARQNEGDAFTQLFNLHHARVFARAMGLLANWHDAENVTAAAFFELWRRRRSVRIVTGSVLPWLLVTTVNLARNARRSTARYEQFLRSVTRAETTDGPDTEPAETRQRLLHSLAQLSPVDAALFVRTALEDVPMTQAAEAVGLKPATARVRLHRARARLRIDLNDLNPIPIPAEGTL